MAADSNYADILERLGDRHQERLADALKTLEDSVADLMAKAPTKDGKLFDLEWAVNARPELRAALEADYLIEVDKAIRDYSKVSAEASKMLSTYGDFTKLDSTVISQLQRLSFQGFEGVANEYLDVLANEVYQSTITGRSFNDTVKNLRQSINGVYIQSDSVEANRLVDIAANGTKAQRADAVRQLQTIYGRDRVGNNLRRFSTQMAQDSLMQFDASINTAIGKESGATSWKYYGSTVRDSRPFCVEHAGQIFTDEEIADTWAGSWKGKSSGDPHIVRGGYNCRHHWRPVLDLDSDIADTVATPAATKIIDPAPDAPPLIKKSDAVAALNTRTKAASARPSSLTPTDSAYNGKSAGGYQLTGGEFAVRYSHGITPAQRRAGLTNSQHSRDIFASNNVKGLTTETLTLLDATLKKTDLTAKAFGVPKIRSISKSQRGANADMGDSVLGLNAKTFNGWSKSAYTSRAGLDEAVDKLEASLAEALAQREILKANYDKATAEWSAHITARSGGGLRDAASDAKKDLLRIRRTAAANAFNKNIDKGNRVSKKLQEAQHLARPNAASGYLRGDDLKNRPVSSQSFFANPADKSDTIIFHEFGHNVHQQYFVTNNSFGRRGDSLPPLEVLLNRMFKNKPHFPTRYSETNSREWFAENFALYKMGRQDLMDRDLKELITAIEESNGTLKKFRGFNFETGE